MRIKCSNFLLSFLGGLLLGTIALSNLTAGEAGQVLNIAIVGPLTTSSKSFGIPQLQGVTLAIYEYNYENLSKGRKINMQIFDDQSDPDKAENDLLQIFNSNNIAIIGPDNSNIAEAMIKKMKENNLKIPVISPLATATELTQGDLCCIDFFRANVSDKIRINKLLDSLFDTYPGTKHFNLVYEENDTYGAGMLADAKEYLLKKGVSEANINAVEYQRDLNANEAAKIVADDIEGRHTGSSDDAILLLGITTDAITFINSVNKEHISSQIYFNEPDDLEFKLAAAQNTDLSNVNIVSVYFSDSGLAVKFKKDFMTHFHQRPSKSAALAYNATEILTHIINRILDSSPPSTLTVQEIRSKISDAISANDFLSGPDKMDDFVVPGQNRFANQEFEGLQFFELTYDNSGNLTATPLEKKMKTDASQSYSQITNGLIAIGCVLVASYFGSLIRVFSKGWASKNLKMLFSVRSFIIDPSIGLSVLSLVLLIVYLFKHDIYVIVIHNLSLGLVCAALVGLLAGYLGTSSFTVLQNYFGLRNSDRPDTA